MTSTPTRAPTGRADRQTARKTEWQVTDWPDWWSWQIELSPHLLKRMVDRGFNEVDLRLMLDDTSGYHRNCEEGRWVITTQIGGVAWEIIVEPVVNEKMLVVVTAYSVE
jgi:hypothetical protein